MNGVLGVGLAEILLVLFDGYALLLVAQNVGNGLA